MRHGSAARELPFTCNLFASVRTIYKEKQPCNNCEAQKHEKSTVFPFRVCSFFEFIFGKVHPNRIADNRVTIMSIVVNNSLFCLKHVKNGITARPLFFFDMCALALYYSVDTPYLRF